MEITHTNVFLDIASGLLKGDEIITSKKKLGQLKGIFKDEATRASMDQNITVYSVQAWMPVNEGTSGGLFFGNSTIFPGKVGNEYFMTRGHFHALADTAEYYWCIKGTGVLLIKDERRNVKAEEMVTGSLHYIPGRTAHRVANTGDQELVFNACWPSDAGHDYETIGREGFASRLLEIKGIPVLTEI